LDESKKSRRRRSKQQIESEKLAILRLLMEGKEDKQIMEELNLSKAIKKYWRRD